MSNPFLKFDVHSVQTMTRPEVLSDRVWDDLKGMMKLCPWLSFSMNQNTEETLVIDGDTEVITISSAKDLLLFLLGYRLASIRITRRL